MMPPGDKSVIFIVGLPGSGKTTFIKSNVCQDRYIIDDAAKNLKSIEELKHIARTQNDVVISDPQLCLRSNQDAAERIFEGFEMVWLFFENDVEACLKNIEERNDGRNISEEYVRRLSYLYHIPRKKPSVVLPVYRKNK